MLDRDASGVLLREFVFGESGGVCDAGAGDGGGGVYCGRGANLLVEGGESEGE